LAVNEGLIRDVVTLSGGALPTAPEQIFTQNRRQARVRVEAWPYLLGLALLIFLPDIALRRFRFSGAARPPAGSTTPTRMSWFRTGPDAASTHQPAGRFGSRARRR
jgi:hypothetical protein